MEFDVRKTDNETIDKIRFADDGYIESGGSGLIDIAYCDTDVFSIRISEIDDLIVALKKAKGLWGNNEH